MRRHGPGRPATITSAATTARKARQQVERAAARAAAGPKGRRDSSSAERLPTPPLGSERVARSQRALELAAAGTHAEADRGTELGVSPDTAKELLRDARFYEDPCHRPRPEGTGGRGHCRTKDWAAPVPNSRPSTS